MYSFKNLIWHIKVWSFVTYYCVFCAFQGLSVQWEETNFKYHPRSQQSFVLCELKPLSNHEEQLSCHSFWRVHCPAAVSGLLRHQMAVSILIPLPSFTAFCFQTLSCELTSLRYTILCEYLQCVSLCFIKRCVHGSFEKGPQLSSSWSREDCVHIERICVLCFNEWTPLCCVTSALAEMLYHFPSVASGALSK